ncbi:MAG: putative nuclease of putative toxin-antitoxin system [Natronomonas sp.]|jgi:predicted nuclease of predicted toxin-antitoxin system|uniref:DUF5615 family PIN-like protein n=1 Tax=Natronomonas sp. TaxID=2184060 RepID=UPI0039898988
MSYSLLADENIERATVDYLTKLGHDIVRVQDIPDLGQGATDDEVVAYGNQEGRLILSQDSDFFTDINPEETAGVLAQRDQRLSAREVGDIIDEMAAYLPQEQVVLEYVSADWL